MLRKSSSSSSTTSSTGGGTGTKQVQELPRPASKTQESVSPRSTKTWTMGRNTKNSSPLSNMGLPTRLMGAPGVDSDYFLQLVNDVRWFADVLLNLKDAFQHKDNLEGLPELVQERLAELLRVLKNVIGKHRTLNSADILGAAGTVIAKVKGINFKEVNSENKQAIFSEIHTSIDTLAFTFGNVVSDFLMGDVDSSSGLGMPQTKRSRSFDNVSVDPEGFVPESRDLIGPALSLSKEEEVDLALQKNDSGVESALLYAKTLSKYIKDLLGCMEKRLAMDIEYAKSYTKMAESATTLASQQDYMPLSDIYISTFKNEIEYNQLLIQTALALQSNKFIQPLQARKNELDKLRKDIKEQWQREQKKMQEVDTTLRKARALNDQRKEEYRKAQSSTNRSQEEQSSTGNKQLEKKRKLEEEAMQKAEEAQYHFQSCRADAGVKRMDLANTKSTILTQIREMIFQCDLTLKAVSVNWFQMQQAQTVSLPTHFQALSENAKLYEPGGCYANFVRNLPKNLPKEHLQPDSFSENFRSGFTKRSQGSTHSSHGNLSQGSITSCDVLSGDDIDHTLHRPSKISERRSNSSTDIPALRSQAPLRTWTSSSQGGMCSDSESAGGSSESRSMDSPTASPGDFKRRLPRTPSTGTMSSADDLDDREPLSPFDNGLVEIVTETLGSPGPFRNTQMSKAAQTHKLRKLRAPSKCRECDSLVVFHGAECEECSLACHKKCLETLPIQCGHKKLQGRLQLFGIDFAQAAKNCPDGIPFIIKKCTTEIESRALNIKGIYRVNGAKSRVEKLCQAFENGKDLVELSELSPHDISNVLKLYLRQLPEPLIQYRFYNNLIGLAKECQRVITEEAEKPSSSQAGEKGAPSAQMSRVLLKIKDLLRQLPTANYRTLRYLITHLNRVSKQADENKMNASNLGIIFGPTLVKPRQIDAEVSLSSLVDYPCQALMVEMMVRHFHTIFDAPTPSGSEITTTTSAQASPRMTPQDKVRQLSRHSTSLTDIKESAKVYKRYSSVIPSSHILDEVHEVQAGKDQSDSSATEKLNGLHTSSGREVQRSTLALSRPSSSLSYHTNTLPTKVQLRNQVGRHVSRPISMPLERLPTPAQILERNNRNKTDVVDGSSAHRDTETIQEIPEPDRARQSGSSRISTYYITPFIDTQTMQRRTWDKKYKHYDMTSRTAMIVANLPPTSSGLQPVKATLPITVGAAATAASVVTATSSVSTMFSSSSSMLPVKSVWSSKREKDAESSASGSPTVSLTLRAPRTLQPPPGTFYMPPGSSSSRSRTLSSWTTTTATSTSLTSTNTSPAASPSTTPVKTHHQTQDSTDSAIDPGVSTSPTLSPPQSPSPSSPDDLSPTGTKPIYQRLRLLQENEHREAHFV